METGTSSKSVQHHQMRGKNNLLKLPSANWMKSLWKPILKRCCKTKRNHDPKPSSSCRDQNGMEVEGSSDCGWCCFGGKAHGPGGAIVLTKLAWIAALWLWEVTAWDYWSKMKYELRLRRCKLSEWFDWLGNKGPSGGSQSLVVWALESCNQKRWVLFLSDLGKSLHWFSIV